MSSTEDNPSTERVIRTIDELTPQWLGEALGRPVAELHGTDRIGTGQMSDSYRVTFTASGSDGETESVVVKLASTDPTSRATGVSLGLYFREVAFYRNLGARIGEPLPRCHAGAYDPTEGWFTLVLEDIAGGVQGDQIAGCSVEFARTAVHTLARVHAPVLGDNALGAADYLNQPNPLTTDMLKALLAGFAERYHDQVAPEHMAICNRFVPVWDQWADEQMPPLGLVHGDYRLDNLLFDHGACKVVDWQTVAWGSPMLDLSYFIGSSLRIEDRRAHERELVRLYHDELVRHGANSLSWEQCWDGYRREAFAGIGMVVVATMMVERTDRGDEMFMTWLARTAQQIIDLDALSMLPEPSSTPPVPLRPDPGDEGRHAQGPEPLWNESWYFDAVSDDESLGVYVRLGRLPNQGICLYTAAICGPGRPSLMVVDPRAPLPGFDDDSQAIETDVLSAEQLCERPLERFRVRLHGVGASYDDQSAPLRGDPGDPVDVELDLVWETDGIPYAWRQTSRYEIPCRVTGRVRVGGEEIVFAGPGQRDHSWGSRDWWAFDWMWSALHLDDGTHTHAVAIPQLPGFGVGYVQRGESIAEVSSVEATETIAGDGLIESARIVSRLPELSIEVEPLGFGALRLEAPDGRVSLFPRAMCRVRTTDGRTGSGWVEWNRVQP
ncbi:MAG TPA: phosphotransferase [Solirubrobacteraceae bacterium]